MNFCTTSSSRLGEIGEILMFSGRNEEWLARVAAKRPTQPGNGCQAPWLADVG